MFIVGILVGIFSYFIFALGLLGMLHRNLLLIITIVFLAGSTIYFVKKGNLRILTAFFSHLKRDRFRMLLFGLLCIQAIVNLIGVLGPEVAFDALWYHLTFPKIYLQEHVVRFIPGNVLYYSVMPKLTEMLYTTALAVQSEILAKGIHYLFGIGCCIVLYQLTKRYFSSMIALLTVLIFYSNLVVGWESITAYIDLTRTFFEILALSSFLRWTENNERNNLALTGVMVGLAISTKLLALGSVVIFLLLITYYLFIKKKPLSHITRSVGIFLFFALSIPLPWFIYAFIHTGNPVYPFFTPLYETSVSPLLLSPVKIVSDLWEIFTHAADPISPIYLMFMPLLVVFYKRLLPAIKLVAMYSLLALIIWYVTPRSGGGRFILPYLPAFSLLAGSLVYKVGKQKVTSAFPLYRFMLILVIVVSGISIGYRGIANVKYLPVIIGIEKKEVFLSRELNFSYGDFYDIDGFFKNTLKPNDRVLLYGFHNLYYVNFPYIHESAVRKGDHFTYIAVQNGLIPKRFWYWPEIYYNPITKVGVYSLRGQEWVY
jgi:hypothetical protein